MITETYQLWEDREDVKLFTFLHSAGMATQLKKPRPAIIICPGGAYFECGHNNGDGDPIAYSFCADGYQSFVLEYSVAARAPQERTLFPAQLLDLGKAILLIREHAEEWCVDVDKISVIGFSAGGHLAASAGSHWNHPVLREEFKGEEEGINRPNGMILSYPVITAGEYAHRGSIKNLSCNENYGEKEIAEWSLELNVDETTPPAFIWHTVVDKVVPVQNSLLLANALTNNGVPYELHIYPYGPHGLSLATEETANGDANKLNPHTQSWAELAVKWIKLQ